MLRSVGHLFNEEDWGHPALRYFRDTVLPQVWERASTKAKSQSPRITGVGWLRRVVSRYIGGDEGAKYARGNTSKATCLTDWIVHVLGSGIETCKPLPQWAPAADVSPEDPR